MRAALFTLAAGLVAGVQPPAEAPPPPADPAERLVPNGWHIETRAAGDLDGDGAADIVLVLLADEEAPAAAPEPGGWEADSGPRRMLAIAFASPEGGYRPALRHTTFLPRKRSPNGLSQGWMLFEDGSIEVSRGRLRILFEYTRGHMTFTFRRQEGAFGLIGYDSAGVSAGCFHGLSINYLTRRVRMAAGWVDRDEELVRWRRLTARAPVTLDRMGQGEEFDPEGLLTGFPLSCPERNDPE